jgi:BioD-like phosphotransacetylase family protein
MQSSSNKLEQMGSIIEKNDDMKTVLNANLMSEQNKILKTQVSSMHRQIDSKDNEIEGL